MQIITVESHEVPLGWHFSKVELRRVNLLVGDSGTGKTRFLNVIFNLAVSAVAAEFKHAGYWDITIRQAESIYRWVVETKQNEDERKVEVVSEDLAKVLDAEHSETLVKRNQQTFVFKGKELPKISKNVASISLLKDEEAIKPLYRGFSNVIRRRFHDDALRDVSGYQVLPPRLLSQIRSEKDLEKIFRSDLGLSARLYVLSELYQDRYRQVIDVFTAVFPFVIETRLIDFNALHKDTTIPGNAPTFCIKERNVKDWIELGDLSSGMQKVLLILTDCLTLPEGGIYLIDEYENSLGISAIDFFPNFLMSHESQSQFLITSHHPYIINNIPFENWLIFHRKGSNVTVKYGRDVQQRFSGSRQEAFIQLINDPFYTEGIE